MHQLLVADLGGDHGERLGWDAGHHHHHYCDDELYSFVHNHDQNDDLMMITLAFQEYWETRGTESDPWHECGSTQVFNNINIFFGPDDGFPIF